MRRNPPTSTYAVFVVLAACSREAAPVKPVVAAEPVATAPADAGIRDAAVVVAPAPAAVSAFSIVARAGYPVGVGTPQEIDAFGYPLPLVERLPGGGLVVASEYAIARADGPGPLTMKWAYEGLEHHVLGNHDFSSQSGDAIRWIHADGNAVAVHETNHFRIGPMLDLYKQAKGGGTSGASGGGTWARAAPHTGWHDPTNRAGTWLAFERTVSSKKIQEAAGFYYETSRARIAVITGAAPSPILPGKICPRSMSAASDGSLLILGQECTPKPSTDAKSYAIRYAPGATQGKVDEVEACEPQRPIAIANDEVAIACGAKLALFANGRWAKEDLFGESENVTSFAASKDGTLWIGTRETVENQLDRGHLRKRAKGGAWTEVALPPSPLDSLETEAYSTLMLFGGAFYRDKEQAARLAQPDTDPADLRLIPLAIDAGGDEVLVTAEARRELFVLSTKAREPAVRLPSPDVQRVQIARTIRRKVAPSEAGCPDKKAFVVFKDGVSKKAIEDAIADKKLLVSVSDATVEGKKRVVAIVWPGPTSDVTSKLGAFGPVVMCGPVVSDEDAP